MSLLIWARGCVCVNNGLAAIRAAIEFVTSVSTVCETTFDESLLGGELLLAGKEYSAEVRAIACLPYGAVAWLGEKNDEGGNNDEFLERGVADNAAGPTR